jgi:hypothetical membrane protein
MQNWKHVFVLLTLEKVEVGATLNNIEGVILDVMGIYEGLTNYAMACKWIYLACDNNSILQGIRFGAITQTKEQIAPILIGVHCMAH